MKKLRSVLDQDNTVLFVGSGLSRWSGLPSWNGLVLELASFLENEGISGDLVRSEAKNGELLQAASYGFDKLTPMQISIFIKQACRSGIAVPHEVHNKVVRLGPRCFVTTNYDDLLEQSLRQWLPDVYFGSSITNRQLVAIADIIQSQRTNFIFKPHGDASDSESVILTREQYRLLMPQGERHAALEALKTLMVTRPVVYIGFGLRDPDFLYLRDLMANTYRGGNVDHYAIMADVSHGEVEYWRKNFGVHLESYPTKTSEDNKTDHSGLLSVLDTLLERKTIVAEDSQTDKANFLLSLARYAAGLSRIPKSEAEFDIFVNSKRTGRTFDYHRRSDLDRVLVGEFIKNGSGNAILLGLPGSGKSYSFLQSTAEMARDLQNFCLSDDVGERPVVPILCDLKFYRGDLADLIKQNLPKNIEIADLKAEFEVALFLDSFNEMPREFRENQSYEADFQTTFQLIGNSRIIIGSRTEDGLEKNDFSVFVLDEIDDYSLERALKSSGIDISGTFEVEIRQLLKRPFYYNLIRSGKAAVPSEPHPRDIYQSFFAGASEAFHLKFGKEIRLETVLSEVACASLDQGEEAFSIKYLLTAVEEISKDTGVEPSDFINWLISTSVIVAHPNYRVSFIHQSITEYLASVSLAASYTQDPSILDSKIILNRWDQALFLCLSLLPAELTSSFIESIIKIDIGLAIRAVKYLELNQEEIVGIILNEVDIHYKEDNDYIDFAFVIKGALPVTLEHTAQLRSIMNKGGLVAAGASALLVALHGEAVKSELLEIIRRRPSDFNFIANGIGPALNEFINDEDVAKLAVWCDEMEQTYGLDRMDDLKGFIAGIEGLVTSISVDKLYTIFIGPERKLENASIRRQALLEAIRPRKTTDALNLSAKLLLAGVDEAAVNIYFNSSYVEEGVCWDTFTVEHVDRLLEIIGNKDSWGISALKNLCLGRDDLKVYVNTMLATKMGLEKAALIACSETSTKAIFDTLADLIILTESERRREPYHILSELNLDWTGNERLLIDMLKLRDNELAGSIFGGSLPPDLGNLGPLAFEPINWWLDWLYEICETESSSWLADQLGWLIGYHLDSNNQTILLDMLKDEGSQYRRVISTHILSNCANLTTQDLDETALSFLLFDLHSKTVAFSFRRHLLANSATEEFVQARLLPLLSGETNIFQTNLRHILHQIGDRLGRRFISDNGLQL